MKSMPINNLLDTKLKMSGKAYRHKVKSSSHKIEKYENENDLLDTKLKVQRFIRHILKFKNQIDTNQKVQHITYNLTQIETKYTWRQQKR